MPIWYQEIMIMVASLGLYYVARTYYVHLYCVHDIMIHAPTATLYICKEGFKGSLFFIIPLHFGFGTLQSTQVCIKGSNPRLNTLSAHILHLVILYHTPYLTDVCIFLLKSVLCRFLGYLKSWLQNCKWLAYLLFTLELSKITWMNHNDFRNVMKHFEIILQST